MRDTIFISHASPDDNDFTIWLASRLQLLGYKVWFDKKNLLGGENFYNDIDKIIRAQAVKFLLVFSKSIIKEPGKLILGIDKELSLAESIVEQENLTDFIIPLKIDESPYNSFIGLNRINHVPFNGNWAAGFQQLVKKLEKDCVFRQDNSVAEHANLYEQLKLHEGIHETSEIYYSSWWQIPELPEFLYIYQFKNRDQVEATEKLNLDYPYKIHGNTFITFLADINLVELNTFENKETIQPVNKYEISIDKILNKRIKSNIFPNQLDCENLLKRILDRTFHLQAKKRGLYWFEMSNKRIAYYFPDKLLERNKVNFELNGKKKNKVLLGKDLSHKWHFAVSIKSIIDPFPAYSLKTHLLFSDNGRTIWRDYKKLHSARRKKGRRFFNEEWRDLLIAFINGLKSADENVILQFNESVKIEMPLYTYSLLANFGYTEPQKEIEIIDDYNESEADE